MNDIENSLWGLGVAMLAFKVVRKWLRYLTEKIMDNLKWEKHPRIGGWGELGF